MLKFMHVALVRQGSLRAAAYALCLAQSALSNTVKKLEQNLGAAQWAQS